MEQKWNQKWGVIGSSPDDHNDTIEDIVGVLNVTERPIDQHFQKHLQGEQAGEHDVADLQCIG